MTATQAPGPHRCSLDGHSIPHSGRSRLRIRHAGDTPACASLRSIPMKRQADLTKRRAVDLCRVAAMLCRTF
ncbi:hypothetical protein F9278_21970 [Streptomyces phaeolivaceus]|uniref:Uncharacterized protein n=1 Tax=Streptomyces phaeolivaceus TaxID=2653200 RepID=A0A5P8K6J8_9ACTN|nr:hypothetical protein F9278_21970 [Streptomyces phaeolivaceus]